MNLKVVDCSKKIKKNSLLHNLSFFINNYSANILKSYNFTLEIKIFLIKAALFILEFKRSLNCAAPRKNRVNSLLIKI